jgi:hypothetical protein
MMTRAANDNETSDDDQVEQDPEHDKLVAAAQTMIDKNRQEKIHKKKAQNRAAGKPPSTRKKRAPKPALNLSCLKTIKANFPGALQPPPSFRVSEEKLTRSCLWQRFDE